MSGLRTNGRTSLAQVAYRTVSSDRSSATWTTGRQAGSFDGLLGPPSTDRPPGGRIPGRPRDPATAERLQSGGPIGVRATLPAMRRVTDRAEYLDGPLEHDVLEANLRDLARFNRWLGGVALTRRALVALATGFHSMPRIGRIDWRSRTLRLLDVGTGAADIPDALLSWTQRRGLRLSVEAVDERHEILDVAYERVGDRPELRLEHTTGDQLAYASRSFDVVHASLVLHHLEPGAAVRLLREMARTADLGVIVNDLDRRRLAWLGAWALTRVITRNRYTRHDAPLSVRRAYRPTEVAQLATQAGLVEVARFRGFLGHRYAMAFVHAGARPPRETPPEARGEASAAPG